jgi:hypothetical protein
MMMMMMMMIADFHFVRFDFFGQTPQDKLDPQDKCR